MATVATTGNGSAASVPNNNGGTIVKGGNVSSTGPLANSVDLIALADDFGESVGSTIVVQAGTSNDKAGINKIVTGNVIAFTPDKDGTRSENYIMKGVSTAIGGGANTFLQSPGSDYNGLATTRTSIHKILQTKTLGSGDTAVFDMYARPSTAINPNFTKGGGYGNTQLFVAPSGDGNAPATDDAASPTRSIPGELTLNFGSLSAPTTYEYKARNVFES